MPSKSLPFRPSLDHLKHQARDLVNSFKTGQPEALARIREFHPRLGRVNETAVQIEKLPLADAQLVVAREYGFESWPKLKRHVEELARQNKPAEINTEASPSAAGPVSAPGTEERYLDLAKDFVAAHEFGDAAAIQRLNEYHGRSFTWNDVKAEVWHNVYKVRQAKSRPGSFALADAQWLLARQAGFGNWSEFLKSATARNPQLPEAYAVDLKNSRIAPRRNLTDKEWDAIFDVMKERRITLLNAAGQMTDKALKGLAALGHVTGLEIGNSQQVTDEGLLELARMPQLEHLDLSNYPGSRITDRGLQVLRSLSALKSFQICWQPGISDAGIAFLESCRDLEDVNLMGTPTGDGAVRALRGKPKLRKFHTGRLVTDAGLALLHDFPVYKQWHGGDFDSLPSGTKPNQLLLDGPFTNDGLASLAGLNGLFGLGFFWNVSALTPNGLAALAQLPHLGSLNCESKLCDDTAMRHIGSLPRLRDLMCQGTVASDDGFAALSRSRTIQNIWGRENPNLTGRGFAALSKMTSLRGLGVSCLRVDDESLSLLPDFPALREVTPIDLTDSGFRHVGACKSLEKLTCMYCRETTDIATGHIAGLSKLKTYYAGLTKITDRSLEILGRMRSLEQIEFYECSHITDAGLVFLSHLPHLKKIQIGASRNVTMRGTTVFPDRVQVDYWV